MVQTAITRKLSDENSQLQSHEYLMIKVYLALYIYRDDNTRSLGLTPPDKSRVETDIPDVVAAEHPGEKPLQSKPVPSVWTRAIHSL